MNSLTLEYPGEWLAPLGTDAEKFAAEAKLAAAMKLYELGRLSSGAAARLAGVPRVVFLGKLADYGVDAFRQSVGDLERETRLA